jgi:hypothetical protein
MHRILLPLLALSLAIMTATSAGEKKQDGDKKQGDGKKKDDPYLSIFDGKSLDGWHVSAQSGHSSKSGRKSGGK